MQQRDTSTGIIDFPIGRVADGYRLIVQLALLEACEQAARVGAALDDLAGDWWGHAEPANNAYAVGDTSADDLKAQADHYEELFDRVVQSLRRIEQDHELWLDPEISESVTTVGPQDWLRRSAEHRRFFIVDEPERHLHPRLQRATASWLKETTASRGAPCLIATHSTPFLALPTDARGPHYVYVDRDEGDTHCREFDAGELLELRAAIVEELGFDRGELLTTVSLFLIVEGVHEVVVMERIYRRELRAARIALIPLLGVSNAKVILDSDVLWRFTTAEVALATDKFDRDQLERVLNNPEEAKALRKSDADEETKLLGQLIGNAQRNNTRIHLVADAGADLIDVLDESVIRREFPSYPGHPEAQRRWATAVADGVKARQRKAFLRAAIRHHQPDRELHAARRRARGRGQRLRRNCGNCGRRRRAVPGCGDKRGPLDIERSRIARAARVGATS